MKTLCLVAVFLNVCGLSVAQVFFWGACPKVTVQENFRVNDYLGRWYEERRFFAIFEAFSKCVSAEYSFRPDGTTLNVNNTGYNKVTRDYTIAIGTAVILDPKNPAKLGVSFFDGQPPGDYWVLSTDYTSYTVVWSCSQYGSGWWKWNTQFAWILTRSQEGISQQKTKELLTKLENFNINTHKFSKTSQTGCP